MKAMRIVMAATVILCLNTLVSAGENLDIKGSFGSELVNTLPEGWFPNSPGYWEDSVKLALSKVTETNKNALQITSQTKAIHLYGKQWSIATGDKCVIKGMVKGKGKGGLGLYYYPGGGFLNNEFQATEKWTEFVAEITIPENKPEIDKVSIVISVSPGASVEFSEITAEIEKQQK